MQRSTTAVHSDHRTRLLVGSTNLATLDIQDIRDMAPGSGGITSLDNTKIPLGDSGGTGLVPAVETIWEVSIRVSAKLARMEIT